MSNSNDAGLKESDVDFMSAALQGPDGSFDSTLKVHTDLPPHSPASTQKKIADRDRTPRRESTKVTLNDVLQEHPSEDKAETVILSETEKKGPTPPVFHQLPNGAEEAFQSLDTASHASGGKKGHHRQPTMEERMDGLTDALKAIHRTEDASTVSGDMNRAQPKTSVADTMSLHSHLLKKRPTAKQRWNKLRTVVVATGLPTSGDQASVMSNSFDVADVETGEVAAESDNMPVSPYLSNSWREKSKPKEKGRVSNIPILGPFLSFVKDNAKAVRIYLNVILFLMLPSVAVAAVLFYFADNYPTGRIDPELSTASFQMNHQGKIIDTGRASLSWWILFIGCRQLATFSLAHAWQFLLIDCFTIGRRWFKGWPVVTLLIVQSRGWPFLLTSWSALSLGLNYGKTPFAAHWMFWQGYVGLFNDKNPTGGVHGGEMYYKILCLGFVIGLVIAAKRTWIGFFLARKTYVAYAGELTALMKNIIALSRIAQLASTIEADYMEAQRNAQQHHRSRLVSWGSAHEQFTSLITNASYNQDQEANLDPMDFDEDPIADSPFVIDPEQKNKVTGELTDEQKVHISALLGAWEEPNELLKVEDGAVSINAVLRFRQSLTFLDTPQLFSPQFGLTDTRQNCIESAQAVYMRLFLDASESSTLKFDIIATLARQKDGSFDVEFLKDLIALIRPARDGTIGLVEFVKSIDAVYKQARLLSASIQNSHKIDVAFEFIFNFLFYVVLASTVLSVLGFSPFQIFLSLSSVILAFAFMIGSASSKYFEGLLFILVQKPYDIGDRINIEPANSAGQSSGSASWIVKDVSLFTTTIVLGSTNEMATVSNGTLASSRIINAARSPHAIITDSIKFGLDVPYEKIKTFKEALTQFVKARPREWLSLIGFRASAVAVDQGYVQYIIILQHRSSWQEIGAVKQSHADVQSYCLELSKEMGMQFKTPVVPVNLSMVDQHKPMSVDVDQLSVDSPGLQRVASLFEFQHQAK